MNDVQAIHSFWSGFGIPAYDENTVPDDARMPYITYEASSGYFGNDVQRTGSLWYRSSSWAAISEMAERIGNYIGRGGKVIRCDRGAIWLKRGSPWSQRMGEPSDDMVRRIVLNLEIEFLI